MTTPPRFESEAPRIQLVDNAVPARLPRCGQTTTRPGAMRGPAASLPRIDASSPTLMHKERDAR